MARLWELDGAGGAIPPCTPSVGNNQLMLTTRVDTTDVTHAIPIETTDEQTFSWTTDTGDPGIADWSDGDYLGSVNAGVVDGNASFLIQLLRRTSACGAGETLGTSTSFAAAGVASFTVNIDPSAGATGDLYQMRVIGSNSHMHNTQAITITIDDANTVASGEFDPPSAISNETTLFIAGKPSGEMDLFIGGKPSGDMDLFIEGEFSNEMDLFIKGQPSGEVPLFTQGTDFLSDGTTLFIQGKGIIPNHDIFFGSDDLPIIYHATSNASDGHIVDTEIVHSGVFARAIAIDKYSQHIYAGSGVTGSEPRGVVRFDFDGSNPVIIATSGVLSTIQSIQLDLINQKIFWSTIREACIAKMDLDGSNLEIIFCNTGDLIQNHFAIDPFNQKIYLARISLKNIVRMDYEGNIEATLFSNAGNDINGIDIDFLNQKLVWTDGESIGGNKSINRINLDGTEFETIISASGTLVDEPFRISINTFEEKLYFSDKDISHLFRSNLDGSNLEALDNPIRGPIEFSNGLGNLSVDSEPENTEVALYIGGKPSGEMDLFISGKPSGEITLFIEGSTAEILTSGDITLFIHGFEPASGDMPLSISGVIPVISGDIPLFIDGTLSSVSGAMTLFIVGCAPKATPVVRPNLFTIPSTVIDIFEREVDALIRDLGKQIKLIYKPTVVDCPNCVFDPIGRKSANRFQPGGPQPFSDGARCPYCRGSGKTEEENSEIILGLVDWKPRDYQDFGISIQNTNTIVGIKTLATDAIKIQRATEAIVDYAISDIIKLRCRKLRDPMVTGLKNSRYSISFWTRI